MKQPGIYQPRTYRHSIKGSDLASFNVTIKETDLFIRTDRNLQRKALKSVQKHRSAIEKYIDQHPLFRTALEPFPVEDDAPRIVKEMAEAAKAVRVGPMAAVAGAIAAAVGQDLLPISPEVIIENGGDIFMKITRKRLVGIYAGESSISGKIALEIRPEDTPLGICTSSGTVGHSLSFGKADAVVVIAPSAALADAAATAIGNMIREAADIEKGIEFARKVKGLEGIVIIKNDKMGAWGKVKMVPV
ncbi:MAG: UPF0280 family protein [Chloroflexi bacterium]|nr:UPF0280 family protein [Chloroflexota bacterium]